MIKLVFLVWIALIISCDDTDYAETESRVKSSTEVTALLHQFSQQEHRIELNGCELLYNGRPFWLGMTIHELKAVFGPHDKEIGPHGTNGITYIWQDIGIVAILRPDKKQKDKKYSQTFGLYLEDLKIKDPKTRLHYRKKDLFLINGVPISKNIPFKDFISFSTYKIDDFYLDNGSYSLFFHCNENIKIEYYMSAKGVWEYTGGGHLMLKSHPNQENINPLQGIEIYSNQYQSY